MKKNLLNFQRFLLTTFLMFSATTGLIYAQSMSSADLQFNAQLPESRVEVFTTLDNGAVTNDLTDPIIDREPGTNGLISTKGTTAGVYAADYFETTTTFDLGNVRFYGFASNPNAFLSTVTGFNVYIYTNNGGVPDGNPEIANSGVLELSNISPAHFINNDGIFDIDLAGANGGVPVTLPAGEYWISAFPTVNTAPTGNGRWNWLDSPTSSPAYASLLIDPANLFGAGATSWTLVSSLIGSAHPSFAWIMTEYGVSLPPMPCDFSIIGGVDAITNVVFGGINNRTAQNSNVGLEDFTHLSASVVQTQSHTIELEGNTGGNYTSYFTVWIDWNQDGVWDSSPGSNEMYEIGSVTNSNGNDGKKAIGTINVPAGAVLGSTNMRVIMNYGTSPRSACRTYNYGQAEDYTVEVMPSSCPTPTNLTVSNITSTSLDLGWSENGSASKWDIEYGPKGFAQGAGTMVSGVTTNPYTITITPGQEYDFYVRAECNLLISSSWSSVFTYGYCEAHSNNAFNFFHIKNVTLNTINNNSTESTYSDFTSVTTDLMPGVAYEVSITIETDSDGYYTYYGVWIDFNGDMIFDSSEESVLALSGGTAATKTVSGSFIVPMDATLGSTRMRVIMNNDAITGPCQSFDYGEVEDYGINIVAHSEDYVYEGGVWSPSNPSGVSTFADNVIIKDGSTSISANTNVKNLSILDNATLVVEAGSVLNVEGGLAVFEDADLIFESTATGDGELGPSPTSIVGEVTVQRYMKDRRSYRMVSSSVTTSTSIRNNWQEDGNTPVGYGTHITGSTSGANGFDPTETGNASMYYADVESQQFVPIGNTDGINLNVGASFLLFVRGDRNIDLNDNQAHSETTLRAKGSLYKGPGYLVFEDVDVTSNPLGGFVMIGNPYQSTVDMEAVLSSANTFNVETGHYYIYDPSIGDFGGYVAVDFALGNNVPSDANKYLQPGQAAQILANDDLVVVEFLEDHKAPGNHSSTSAAPLNNMLSVELYTTENFSNGGPVHDGFKMVFDDSYSNALTSSDVTKAMNLYENIGIDNNGAYLSIERREMPVDGEMFQLYTNGYTKSNYTLNIGMNGLEGYTLYLYDNYLETSTQLINGEVSYNFTVTSDPLSMATDRFVINVAGRLGIGDYGLFSGISLFPNPLSGDVFYINAPQLNGKQVGVSVSDMSGRQIFNSDVDCVANKIAISLEDALASGVYLVTLRHNGVDHTLRLVKE